ncbi:MAG: cohesin domain-containing protein, partial [bacterium]
MFPRKAWGVLILSALLALPGYAQKSITVTDQAGGQGQTVTVPVNLSDGASVAGSNFTLTYDSNVLQNASITGGALLSGHSALSNVPTAGELRGLIYANPTAAFNSGAGTMANLSFTISPNANPGSTNLTFTEGVLADNTGAVLAGTTTTGGAITVTGSSFPITES